MENYIVLHGVKMELTEDQIKLATKNVEPKKSEMELAFDRVKEGDIYGCICSDGAIHSVTELSDPCDDELFETANYCTDESLLKQRALQEILSRQLWRFSMINGGDKINIEDRRLRKYFIYWNINSKDFYVNYSCDFYRITAQYFVSREIANRAIEEIVKPFIGKHPELTFA